jgi:peptide deformylase
LTTGEHRRRQSQGNYLMTLHSFRSVAKSYGRWPTGILPTCRQRLGRIARFCRLPALGRAAFASIKLSSGGTLATFFGQKHDIALITPMTKLVILEYPDPRLRKTAALVAAVDDAMRQLADDMLETMYAAKGVGLAATQVDVHKRMIVLDVSEGRDQPLVLINPELLKLEGSGPGEEGCLSLPGIYDKLTRATHIRVRALGRDGRLFEMDADGLLAVCIQHEMDHLDGKLFVDYLSELKRQLIRRRLEKERKQRSAGGESRATVSAAMAYGRSTPGVTTPGTSTPAL